MPKREISKQAIRYVETIHIFMKPEKTFKQVLDDIINDYEFKTNIVEGLLR